MVMRINTAFWTYSVRGDPHKQVCVRSLSRSCRSHARASNQRTTDWRSGSSWHTIRDRVDPRNVTLDVYDLLAYPGIEAW